MGLLNLLKTSLLGWKGQTPPSSQSNSPNSTLHNTSSINGSPTIVQKPSNLDLDGKTPPRYLDNPPK